MIEPMSSEPPPCARSAVPSRGQNRSSAGYSVPQVGHSFGAVTLDALDAEDLVAHEDALSGLELPVAVHRERHPVPAARIVHEEFGVLAADLGVAATHRRIVRKHPVAGFAPDEDRTRRREVTRIAY